MTQVVQSTAQHEDASAPEHAPVRGLPGAASARPEPSRASSSSGAAEHTGGPRGSVNEDEFLEDCSEAFPPPPPAVPLPGVLPPPPAVPPPHPETGGAPEHAHAPTPGRCHIKPKSTNSSAAGKTYRGRPPLAAAAASSPAAAAAAAAGKPLPEVLRAAFDEVIMPVSVEHGRRLRREASGLWLPDEWLPVDSETWRMRVYGAAEHTVQQ